jgi:succinate-semialdehyde dehydrogenase/glutarate-semialdehyde dehydrogenase
MLRAVNAFARLQPLLARQPSSVRAMASWQTASGRSGSVADQLKDPTLFRTQAFVAGAWVDTGTTFEVLDPASGGVVATVAACGTEEVEAAVAAADVAQKAWAKKTGKERGLVLKAWHELMVANADDLATLLTLEAGKPLAEARGEVTYAASFFEWFGEEAKRAYGETIPATLPGRRLLAIKQPVGVAAMITPWNFPSAMLTRKVQSTYSPYSPYTRTPT